MILFSRTYLTAPKINIAGTIALIAVFIGIAHLEYKLQRADSAFTARLQNGVEHASN
jgi:ABC-type long-subunit fatty acid transport system fused permease/ATPase subunit